MAPEAVVAAEAEEDIEAGPEAGPEVAKAVVVEIDEGPIEIATRNIEARSKTQSRTQKNRAAKRRIRSAAETKTSRRSENMRQVSLTATTQNITPATRSRMILQRVRVIRSWAESSCRC